MGVFLFSPFFFFRNNLRLAKYEKNKKKTTNDIKIDKSSSKKKKSKSDKTNTSGPGDANL